MNRQTFAFIVALALCVSATFTSAEDTTDCWSPDVPNVRATFADVLQRVVVDFDGAGSTMDEVRTLLGEPDDVLTEEDRSSWPNYVTWCYGTDGHLTLPTLGSITFDDKSRAWSLQGAGVFMPSVDLPPEQELRDLLRLVHSASPDFTSPAFNPREVVRVVNTLRGLGKNTALAVLSEFGRIQKDAFGEDNGLGAAILMRFLFAAPEGETHPTTYLPFEEYKSREYPAFPAVVIEGVPLYLFPLGGWGMGGGMPHLEEYTDWYRKNGELIAQPLRPQDDPRKVLESWTEGPYRDIGEQDANHAHAADELVRVQMLRIIDTVHPRQFDENELYRADAVELWRTAVATLRDHPVRWDEQKMRYVFATDGSSLELRPEVRYRRVIWELPIEGRSARLIVERQSERRVWITLEEVAKDSSVIEPALVHVYVVGDPVQEIVSLATNGSMTSGSSSSGHGVALKKGTLLRAVMIRNGEIIAEIDDINPDEEIQVGE